MKPAVGRLSLNRETIRDLDPAQLGQVAGGASGAICYSLQQCVNTLGRCLNTQFNTCASCITITASC
jgi:hypothetical protein